MATIHRLPVGRAWTRVGFDDLTVPPPPGAIFHAVCRRTRRDLGAALFASDARCRKLPTVYSSVAAFVCIWDGTYFQALPPDRVELFWTLDERPTIQQEFAA